MNTQAKKTLFIQQYKSARGCARCGFNEHPVALHLAHIDQRDKHPKLRSRARSRSIHELSWSDMHEELPKCEVLCANCHSIETFMEKHHLFDTEAEQ